MIYDDFLKSNFALKGELTTGWFFGRKIWVDKFAI